MILRSRSSRRDDAVKGLETWTANMLLFSVLSSSGNISKEPRLGYGSVLTSRLLFSNPVLATGEVQVPFRVVYALSLSTEAGKGVATGFFGLLGEAYPLYQHQADVKTLKALTQRIPGRGNILLLDELDFALRRVDVFLLLL